MSACQTYNFTIKFIRFFFSFLSFQIKTPPPAEDLTASDTVKATASKDNSGVGQSGVAGKVAALAPKKDDNPKTVALDKRALQPKQGQAKAPIAAVPVEVSSVNKKGELVGHRL